MSEEATIPALPAEALAAVTQVAETDTANAGAAMEAARARDDKGRFTAREEAEKRGEVALKKEFPDLFAKDQVDDEQPEVEAERPATNGSKEKPDSAPSREAESEPTPRQLGRADAILARAKLSKERIEAMPAKERVALARELKPVVVAWQQAEQRKTDPQYAPETIEKQKAGSPAGEPPDSLPQGFKEAVKAASSDYGPEFGAHLEKIVLAAISPLQAELAKAKADVARADGDKLKAGVDRAREALLDRFQDLEDDETFTEDVLPLMVGIQNARGYDLSDPKQLLKCMTQAAVAAELHESNPQAKAEDETVARLTRNGTANSRSRSTPYTGKTRDEKLNLAGKLAQDPKISVEDARRRVWGS